MYFYQRKPGVYFCGMTKTFIITAARTYVLAGKIANYKALQPEKFPLMMFIDLFSVNTHVTFETSS